MLVRIWSASKELANVFTMLVYDFTIYLHPWYVITLILTTSGNGKHAKWFISLTILSQNITILIINLEAFRILLALLNLTARSSFL